MNLNDTLNALFPKGHDVQTNDGVLTGNASVGEEAVAVIGTQNTEIGLNESLALSQAFQAVIQNHSGRTIVLLVDNNGQRMALKEELLGLSQYLANQIRLQDLARRQGHKVIAIVYGNSIAGGFIACGMGADRIYALADADTSVMSLKAISRVTHLSLEHLESLSRDVPIFAPGLENFYKAGGIHAIWQNDYADKLLAALDSHDNADNRASLGSQRNGRTMAESIINQVASAP